PALAPALRAGGLDHLAQPGAPRADAGGDHLTEDRLADGADLPHAAAVGTGGRLGAGRGPGRLARLARHRGAHLDGGLGAEDRLFEVDLGDHLEVGAGGRARAATAPEPPTEGVRTAEEGLEDVAEPTRAERIAAARPGRRALRAEQVVALAALRVAQRLVGDRDLLEPALGLGIVGVGVGVQLARQAAV